MNRAEQGQTDYVNHGMHSSDTSWTMVEIPGTLDVDGWVYNQIPTCSKRHKGPVPARQRASCRVLSLYLPARSASRFVSEDYADFSETQVIHYLTSRKKSFK